MSIDMTAVQAYCESAGLRMTQRNPTHVQVYDDHARVPIVDIWPTTGKFLEARSASGVKARTGSEKAVIAAIKGVLAKRLNAPAVASAVEAFADVELAKSQPAVGSREYFAAAALQGLLAAHRHYGAWRDVCRDAIDCADAMLAELAESEKAGAE